MPAWAATIDAARGSTKAGALFEARGRCGSFLAWIVNNRASDRAHRAGDEAGFSRARILPGPRAGRKGRSFACCKFRTMVVNADGCAPSFIYLAALTIML